MSIAEARAQGRHEAAPAAFVALAGFVALAVASQQNDWGLLGLTWWIWLLVTAPLFLLTVDLALTRGGAGIVRSRQAALWLLAWVALGNFVALTILVAGLITTSNADLGPVELLFTGFTIWTGNVIVFGLWFWELEAGGPATRVLHPERPRADFRYPQDMEDDDPWQPQVWDYLYVSLTNSIAFSPTDTMPLSIRAKTMMSFESLISAATFLLVAARAVNELGT